jgi:Na+/glutamate symporter
VTTIKRGDVVAVLDYKADRWCRGVVGDVCAATPTAICTVETARWSVVVPMTTVWIRPIHVLPTPKPARAVVAA